MNTMPKIALGAWSWGAGAAGGDQVFGNHLFEDDLRPVFDKALECGLTLWDTAAAGLKINAVQNHFSLLHRSSERAGILDYCKENGITFYAYMVLEQGALSGKYDAAHPFPEGSDRARCYGSVLPQLGKLIEKMRQIGSKYNASPAQIATAWAIAKGTLPIIGVTKAEQVKAAAKATEIVLTEAEVTELEALGDAANINTLREWEKEM